MQAHGPVDERDADRRRAAAGCRRGCPCARGCRRPAQRARARPSSHSWSRCSRAHGSRSSGGSARSRDHDSRSGPQVVDRAGPRRRSATASSRAASGAARRTRRPARSRPRAWSAGDRRRPRTPAPPSRRRRRRRAAAARAYSAAARRRSRSRGGAAPGCRGLMSSPTALTKARRPSASTTRSAEPGENPPGWRHRLDDRRAEPVLDRGPEARRHVRPADPHPARLHPDHPEWSLTPPMVTYN